jgi:hypothetical protein
MPDRPEKETAGTVGFEAFQVVRPGTSRPRDVVIGGGVAGTVSSAVARD